MKIYKAVVMSAALGLMAVPAFAQGSGNDDILIGGVTVYLDAQKEKVKVQSWSFTAANTYGGCANNLKQIGLALHSATLYVGSANGGVWKTTNGGQTWPSVVIEGKGGTKIAFTNAKVREVVPADVPDVLKVTLDFESTTATPQLVESMLAGR